MKINEIISFLESGAAPSLQEHYDNAGLITGDSSWECSGIICALDATEEVIREAIGKNCNMVVAHHPIVYAGLKKINGKNYVERTVIRAIKNDIAIYAIHTNLDNIADGVNGKIAAMLELQNTSVLEPKEQSLRKLFTFVPTEKAAAVRQAIFDAGAGQIGNYSECSFNTEGTGTFKAGKGAKPYVGELDKQHQEKETKVEIVFPSFAEKAIIHALRSAHPYEEVAYDIVPLSNKHPGIGSGMIGILPEPITEKLFLEKIRDIFKVPLIRHTAFLGKPVLKVAVCGGAGSFLISKALAAKADVFVSSDIKYHEFFEANGQMLICDIGHYESEQFTIDLLAQLLQQKFPNFAVLKTGVITNPLHYFS
jgi:dinuclear metal center YbgI/SA1388 family protein